MTDNLTKSANLTTPAARKKAREMLMQSLYQWEMAGQSIHSIEAQFYSENNMDKVDRDYYRELLHGIPAKLGEIDDRYAPLLDRRVDELDPVSLSIIRIGSYEMAERLDVPFKVVINEAVNLAKKYGPEDSQKFVNAVMDRLAPRLRKTEVEAMRKPDSSNKPAATTKPADSKKPVVSKKPTISKKPASSKKPTISKKPASSKTPSATTKSDDSSK